MSENALAIWTRAQQTGRLDEVDQAIDLGLRAIAAAGVDHPDRVTFVSNVGTYHLTRFGFTGQVADLDQAIVHLEHGVAAPVGPNHALFRCNLGTTYLSRFEMTGQAADLDRAIDHFTRAVAITLHSTYLGNLGAARWTRFGIVGDHADLDQAIKALHQAIATGDNDPNRALFLGNLGAALHSRYEHTGDLTDLDQAVDAARQAIAADPGNPNLSYFLSTLGTTLHSRYERTGDLTDLDQAIEHHERALVATPDRQAGLAMRLSNLGTTYRTRFDRTGRLSDLDRAIDAGQRAVALAGDSPRTATWLSNLGISYQTRFERTGHLADLDLAVELNERAVAATPDGHPEQGIRLANLTSAYTERHEHTGDVADVDRAIETGRRAIAVTRDEHPGLPAFLANLGMAHHYRYECTGDLADLELAVVRKQRAVALTPADHPDRAQRLSGLGMAHEARYGRTGRVADLDRAVECGREAVALTPVDHPDRALRLNNVASAYHERYAHLGSLSDLDRAVEFYERAVAATPDDHPRLVICLSNLGNVYLTRAKRASSLSDVDSAIATTRRAVDATPEDHPDRSLRLHNLAQAHLERFEQARAGDDVDLAVDLALQAVRTTPEGHPRRGLSLSTLSTAHQARFRHTRSLLDVDSAVTAARLALAATPDDHPNRAARLYRLALGYQNRFDAGADRPSHDELATLISQVDAVRAAPPGDRIMAGWAVGRLARALGEPESARRLLDNAVRLLPSVASRETSHTDQEHRLGGRIGLVGEAIGAHCALGDPGGALEVAEHSRGILLGAQLDSRTDLTDLATTHPELAGRFRLVRDNLNALDLGTDVVERRARLWTEYDALLDDIRSRPGLDRFLLPPSWKELRPAAGEVVVLVNAGWGQGDAIVIAASEPVHIPLPRLAAADVTSWATEMSDAINDPSPLVGELRRQRVVSDLLAWLWDAAVGPVLDVVAPIGRPTRRVWWMPTGRLGLLPLHAAAPRGGPGALDRVISSYTPTLRALAGSRGGAPASARRQLTVALQRTPGLPDLPATAAEATSPQSGHPGTVISDDQVTVNRVLAALPEASWAHFACHAGTDPRTPSEGCLHLHDGPLPIARISRLELHAAELAYLSACATGQVGWRHANESIHLASAFQLAGFRHVIASLWPLDDRTAATAAERFYALMPATSSAAHAPYALHAVTCELRAALPDRPHLWASLVHSGP
ncbi:tetratricopeptide (TPR) repeat protein [Saccharothrix ecbatanensis]|uniref:Tetratricopeptide (TPR) repeat protein n=1 Tax=Saccharothrix ecbatanensis TaxID=1105145 RepID=A0A7W9HIZ3_9PSEU|nr:CHAT domain-containing protein [Saccharothrix ecbatanensis]MBB5803182.1 tetratricopeptide (TPR) repeat protein [Saccharothrix ecbatanensis]